MKNSNDQNLFNFVRAKTKSNTVMFENPEDKNSHLFIISTFDTLDDSKVDRI